VKIEAIETCPTDAWDAFVRDHPDSTPFHTSAWHRVLRHGYGFPNKSLIATQDGDIAGILPLYLVRQPLGGRVLISAPQAVYGGALAKDVMVQSALEEQARAIAAQAGVAYLEIRGAGSVGEWHSLSHYATFRKTLPRQTCEVLGSIPRKQRAEVRKGEKLGLTVEVDTTLDRFYPIYATSVHRLGSPVFPRRYAEGLMREFGEDCEILTVTQNDEAIASLLSLRHKGWAMPYHAGGTNKAMALSAFPVLYAAAMERAVQREDHGFDFGRSITGTGAFDFKRNFGFEPTPLTYRVALIRATQPPDMRPDNPRLKPIVAAWKMLPALIANRLGPWVSRQVV